MKRSKNLGNERAWWFPVLGAVSVLALGVGWYAITRSMVRELFIPSPESVFTVIVDLNVELVEHTFSTLLRVVGGWGMGCILGVGLGLAMSSNSIVHALANPLVEGLRPVPPIALIPFFILWFGLGSGGQLGLIGLGAFMVMVVNTYEAVRTFPPLLLKAAKSLGASKRQLYTYIILPGIVPNLASGLRIAAALAFATAIAAEFMGAQTGLGFLIMNSRRILETNTILLCVIIIGIESFALDLAIRRAVRIGCRWMPPQEL